MTSGFGDVPYLKVYNLTTDGSLDFTNKPTFISRATHETELARSRVYPGDILMNIVGPPLGKVSIVPGNFPEWNINQAIALFRPSCGCDSNFLASYLLSDFAVSTTIKRAKATVGQYNLTLEICRTTAIPLPPLLEQLEIVHRIHSLFALSDAIEKRVEAALERTEKVAQAVLTRAFRGELVLTEAELARQEGREYQPASVLLQRTRTQPAKQRRAGVGRHAASRNGSGQ